MNDDELEAPAARSLDPVLLAGCVALVAVVGYSVLQASRTIAVLQARVVELEAQLRSPVPDDVSSLTGDAGV